jgi:hypothetical protein
LRDTPCRRKSFIEGMAAKQKVGPRLFHFTENANSLCGIFHNQDGYMRIEHNMRIPQILFDGRAGVRGTKPTYSNFARAWDFDETARADTEFRGELRGIEHL